MYIMLKYGSRDVSFSTCTMQKHSFQDLFSREGGVAESMMWPSPIARCCVLRLLSTVLKVNVSLPTPTTFHVAVAGVVGI